jgi:lipoate---protein ligase
MGALRDAQPRTRRRHLGTRHLDDEVPPQAKGARGPFPLLVRTATPTELVLELPDPAGSRLAVLARPTSAAIVLGSTQGEGTIDAEDAARRDVTILRRRSGGGAVYVAPGAQVWLDLFVPTGDALADRDVGRAAEFVGELWVEALTEVLGPAGAGLAVHQGPLRVTPWSRLVCFSGLGSGEVTLAGRKLVGLSQRRDRRGAWFFTLAHLGFDPGGLAALVQGLDPDERARLASELEGSVATIDAPAEAVEDALRAALGAA